MTARVVHGHGLIPMPRDSREAARWALVVAPAGLILGLGLGWVIGRWRHR